MRNKFKGGKLRASKGWKGLGWVPCPLNATVTSSPPCSCSRVCGEEFSPARPVGVADKCPTLPQSIAQVQHSRVQLVSLPHCTRLDAHRNMAVQIIDHGQI